MPASSRAQFRMLQGIAKGNIKHPTITQDKAKEMLAEEPGDFIPKGQYRMLPERRRKDQDIIRPGSVWNQELGEYIVPQNYQERMDNLMQDDEHDMFLPYKGQRPEAPSPEEAMASFMQVQAPQDMMDFLRPRPPVIRPPTDDRGLKMLPPRAVPEEEVEKLDPERDRFLKKHKLESPDDYEYKGQRGSPDLPSQSDLEFRELFGPEGQDNADFVDRFGLRAWEKAQGLHKKGSTPMPRPRMPQGGYGSAEPEAPDAETAVESLTKEELLKQGATLRDQDVDTMLRRLDEGMKSIFTKEALDHYLDNHLSRRNIEEFKRRGLIRKDYVPPPSQPEPELPTRKEQEEQVKGGRKASFELDDMFLPRIRRG
jgi:hypothetical protein